MMTLKILPTQSDFVSSNLASTLAIQHTLDGLGRYWYIGK